MVSVSSLILVKKDSLRVFALEGSKISSSVVLSLDPSKKEVKCSCTAFSVVGTCTHFRDTHLLLETKSWKFIHPSASSVPIPLTDGQVGVILKSTDKATTVSSAYLLLPPQPSVHLFQVVDAIKENKYSSIMGTASSHSYKRIFIQTEEAFNRNLPFVAKEITEVPVDSIEEVDSPVKKLGEELRDLTEELSGKKFSKKETKKSDDFEVSVPSPAWSSVKAPDDFWVDRDVWLSLLWCASEGDNCILFGPTGSGKTELAFRVAKALGIDIEPFNFGATSEARISLIGQTHFNKEKGTFFNPSRFVQALQKDSGIVLTDEITRADYTALNILFPVMDGQKYLALDESEEKAVVYRGKNVAFFATANVGYEYTGTEALDRALKDRMCLKIHLDYPPISQEVAIAVKRFPSVNVNLINKICEVAAQQRDMAKDGLFNETISTRMVLDCVKCISGGLTPKVAVRFTITECFSPEGKTDSEQMKVFQLFQKHASSLV